MHIGMRVFADRSIGGNTVIRPALLNFATPDRCSTEFRMIAAAQINEIAVLGVNGDCQIVVALRLAIVVDRQQVRKSGDGFPCLAYPVEAIEPTKSSVPPGADRVHKVGVSELDAK